MNLFNFTHKYEDESSNQKLKIDEDEINYLIENDSGDISNKVLKYDKKYYETGFHRPNWKLDYVEGSQERLVIEPYGLDGAPMVLYQWSHPGSTGSYFTIQSIEYENLQLNDVIEKRELHRYKVIKPLEMIKSKIANQNFTDGYKGNEYQYEPAFNFDENFKKADIVINAADLIEAGYLVEILNNENDENEKDGIRGRKDILRDISIAKSNYINTNNVEYKEKIRLLRIELDEFDEKEEIKDLDENTFNHS